MLALLEEINQKTPDENAYLGDTKLREMLADFETRPGLKRSFDQNWKLGKDLLRVGKTDQAIVHYDLALKVFENSENLPKETKRDFMFDMATAHFRRGETENCVCGSSADSCLLPIRGGGIHTKTRGI